MALPLRAWLPKASATATVPWVGVRGAGAGVMLMRLAGRGGSMLLT